MAHPLDGPFAKIRRAEKHLDEFEVEREKWIKSSPYAILRNRTLTRPSGLFVCTGSTRRSRPRGTSRDSSSATTSTLYRSALDQLVWQLVTVANKVTPKHDSDVSFPIVTSHPTDVLEPRVYQAARNHLRVAAANTIATRTTRPCPLKGQFPSCGVGFLGLVVTRYEFAWVRC